MFVYPRDKQWMDVCLETSSGASPKTAAEEPRGLIVVGILWISTVVHETVQ